MGNVIAATTTLTNPALYDLVMLEGSRGGPISQLMMMSWVFMLLIVIALFGVLRTKEVKKVKCGEVSSKTYVELLIN